MKRIAIAVVLIALLPAALFAQDELTLDDVATKIGDLGKEFEILVTTVQGLTSNMQIAGGEITSLKERMGAVEAIWSGPGAWDQSVAAKAISENSCLIAIEEGIQNETGLKHLNQFGEFPNVKYTRVHQVMFNPDDGNVEIIFSEMFADKFVVETWNGCEFVGASDWWEED